jgi:hypothetical protein
MPDEAKLNNSKSKNMERVYSRGPSFKKLENMDYLEILDSYIEYPSKNLKFTVTNSNGERDKVKFINEEEKAYGWRQNHSSCRKTSKFLQTNLHYLPEHLWKSKKSFVDKTVNSTVGYKVKDNNINYFVHKADSDSITEELFEEIKMDKLSKSKGNIREETRENIRRLNTLLVEKGIESWMTIRASKLLEGSEKWENAVTNYITN